MDRKFWETRANSPKATQEVRDTIVRYLGMADGSIKVSKKELRWGMENLMGSMELLTGTLDIGAKECAFLGQQLKTTLTFVEWLADFDGADSTRTPMKQQIFRDAKVLMEKQIDVPKSLEESLLNDLLEEIKKFGDSVKGEPEITDEDREIAKEFDSRA